MACAGHAGHIAGHIRYPGRNSASSTPASPGTLPVRTQVLVELAMEREEDIPALIYEARPSVRPWCLRVRRTPPARGMHAQAVLHQ